MAPFLLNGLALLSTTTASNTASQSRKFQFVEYGQTFPDRSNTNHPQRPTISCDGRVEGTTLELTHWNGNTTPDQYYADTSTEMALKLENDRFQDAIILNNHFDTDGVLSVFCCLQPTIAQRYYADLLIAGAEAGDFGEWSSDAGVKLDCALCNLLSRNKNDEEATYSEALEILPELLKDLDTSDQQAGGGKRFEHLWKSGFEHACSCYDTIQEGSATFQQGPANIVILKEPFYLSAYAVHRGLVDSGLWKYTTRLLRIQQEDDKDDGTNNNVVTFRYEMPGHGWVHKLKTRREIPRVGNVEKLVDSMGSKWKTGGPGGLVALCQARLSSGDVANPEQIASQLAELDEGSSW